MTIDSVSESTLITLRSLPDEIAAIALDGHLRKLEAQWKQSFYQRGIVLLEMKQRLLWKHLPDPSTGEPYTSLEKWILVAAPHSRSDCYAALKVVEELRDIPRHELEDVPRCNMHILQALSSNIRQDEDVLIWARRCSQKDFVAKIEEFHPNQHIESRRMLHLNPIKSASVVIEQGMKLCMQVEGLTTREQVLEHWAMEYIHTHAEAEAV